VPSGAEGERLEAVRRALDARLDALTADADRALGLVPDI